VLIKLLDYQDEDARRSALVALIKIGLEPWYDRWEDSFSNDRTDDPFRTGSDFTDALRRIGKAAVPWLIELMKDQDQDEFVCGRAADALETIGLTPLCH
jgi:HEAT repeat protein